MSTSASDARNSDAGRLGGARADFVASLGRKVADARDLLSAIEDDPTSKVVRDELRRRLHALGSGARLLRFDGMARAIQEALVVLEHAAQLGALRESEVAFVGQTLDDLPALAWGETASRQAPAEKPDEPEDTAGHSPTTVLVVGGEGLADALMDDDGSRQRAFECERVDDVEGALQLARAYAPDLMLVDADVPRTAELVEALIDDPLTEPVPLVVVGTFRNADEVARFVALGVARALAKPITPEVIRRTCDEVLDARDGRTVRMTLGEPTVQQLAERLADELKRALVDTVDRPGRQIRVPLGEGTEVLGALWGAIARVQEIVAARTGGAVRFGGDAPEGAIALAPSLRQDAPGADRWAGRGRGAGADVRLDGRRIVVADDDPGVTWFISDLLRTAGCDVYEALDGKVALDLAYRVQPELIVSDILMPGLDGFALSRALRRDVALRDAPVILLSWKEDLLQRVRELGAGAAAYMRKESDSRAILARVREVLRPRARLEARLRADGEVRGRLDGLSPRLLLELVCAIRTSARLAVRDATFFYEIDIRGGAPRKVTRTASDGNYLRGERALASLLGVGGGRFVVTTTNEPIRSDLTGTLFEQLTWPIAAARGALAATTGSATIHLERILIDDALGDEYLRATPEPARALIQRLVAGESPRELLLAGGVSPALLEDVLSDLAARGAIKGVEGPDGIDCLTPAVDAALAVVRGSAVVSGVVPPNARSSAPGPLATSRSRVPGRAPSPPPPPPAISRRASPPPPSRLGVSLATAAADSSGIASALGADARPHGTASAASVEPRAEATGTAGTARAAETSIPLAAAPDTPLHAAAPSRGDSEFESEFETFKLSEPPPIAHRSDDDAMPSSLEDAVMREISERSPTGWPTNLGPRRSIVEPSELRPRSSNPPPSPDEADAPALPSIPPDAIVPEASSAELAAASPTPADPTRAPRMATEGAQREARVPASDGSEPPPEGPFVAPFEVIEEHPDAGPFEATSNVQSIVRPPTSRGPFALPSAALALAEFDDEPAGLPSRRGARPGAWLFGALIVGGALAAFIYWLGWAPEPTAAPVAATSAVPSERSPFPAATHPTASAKAVPSSAPAPSLSSLEPPLGPRATMASAANGGALSAAAVTSAEPSDGLPAGAEVPKGYGFLEVNVPTGARVRVDGAPMGAGPVSGNALPPGYHEITVEQDGRQTQQPIEVRAGKTTRVRLAPPP